MLFEVGKTLGLPAVAAAGAKYLAMFAWQLEELWLAHVLAFVGLILLGGLIIWVSCRSFARTKGEGYRYARRIRAMAAGGIVIMMFFLVSIVTNWISFSEFYKEAQRMEEYFLLVPKREPASDAKFVVFVQDFESHGVTKPQANVAKRIYEHLAKQVRDSNLRIEVRNDALSDQGHVQTMVESGKGVFLVSGWYDNYKASVNVVQHFKPSKKEFLYSPPPQSPVMTAELSSPLSHPREWQYFIRINAAKEVVYIVMHLIGNILLADESPLLYEKEYRAAWDNVFACFKIAENNVPRRVGLFGFRPELDPRLRPEILYNDMGRASYIRALRTNGPFLGRELEQLEKDRRGFMLKMAYERYDHIEEAERHIQTALNLNPEFTDALFNEIKVKFGQWMWFRGSLAEYAAIVAKIEKTLQARVLDDSKKQGIEAMLQLLVLNRGWGGR